MTDQPPDPEEQLASFLGQAGQLSQMLIARANQEMISGPPRQLYERVPWGKVNQFAAEGWTLTAVMSDGLHVMQREFTMADAAAEIVRADTS